VSIDSKVIQDRIAGRTEAEACLELAVKGSDAFNRAFAEEMRRFADGVLGPPVQSLSVMTDDQANRFEHHKIEFGKHCGSQYRDIPIDYLVWLADSALELSAYLRSDAGKRRIDIGE
jgi:hypothetical protein